MAFNPVGSGASIATGASATKSSYFAHQSNTLRVVAVGQPCHVAVGASSTVASSNFFLAADTETTISCGRPSSQRVVAITTGTSTQIDFPEGTGGPFYEGQVVSLSVNGDQSYYDFDNKVVSAISQTWASGDNQANYFGTRITVANDWSGIVTAFNGVGNNSAELRDSIIVGALGVSGNAGQLYFQQVQISGSQA